ncbi:MAG: glycosyltransferase [Bacteroidota bacterium]
MDRSRIRISLSMIVKDEEAFLASCLESVKGVVDEMVIVDTGSTDRTLSIAREAGARVIQMEWTGDFSVARNRSLDECTGEWVLCLDADERLAPGQSARIQSLVAQPSVDAYVMRVRSVLRMENGKKTVQVMPYPRLFRRVDGVGFERAIHEQIAPSILRRGGTIVQTDLLIEHLGYDRGFDILKQKVHRNLGPLLEKAGKDPADWYAKFQLARSFMLVQDYPAVIHHARAALSTLGVPKPIAASLHNLLAEAFLKTKNTDSAVQHCRKSLVMFPNQTGVKWFLAGAYMIQGNLRTAISLLETMTAAAGGLSPQSADGLHDIVIAPDVVWEALGRCYQATGNLERSAQAFACSLELNPLFPGAIEKLVEVLEKLSRPGIAVQCLRQTDSTISGNGRLLSYLAINEYSTGDHREALRTLERVLEGSPGDPTALSLKAQWALRLKDLCAASAAIADAEKHGVHSDELTRCAFELAFQEGRFKDALEQLDGLRHFYEPGDFETLKSRLSHLAQVV